MNILSLPGSIWWRPFQKNNFVNRQISFQNRVRWLGGRFSNSPPSAIPGRWQIVSRRLILKGAWLDLCRPTDSVTLTNPLKAAPVLGALHVVQLTHRNHYLHSVPEKTICQHWYLWNWAWQLSNQQMYITGHRQCRPFQNTNFVSRQNSFSKSSLVAGLTYFKCPTS